MIDEVLRTELLRRQALDQEIRTAIMADYTADEQMWERMRAVDRDNTAWLRGVVDATGWPGRSRVGDDGAVAAWLIAQHADQDPAFQRRCLDLVGELAEGEVDADKVALDIAPGRSFQLTPPVMPRPRPRASCKR